jgi:hypothetical protein
MLQGVCLIFKSAGLDLTAKSCYNHFQKSSLSYAAKSLKGGDLSQAGKRAVGRFQRPIRLLASKARQVDIGGTDQYDVANDLRVKGLERRDVTRCTHA